MSRYFSRLAQRTGISTLNSARRAAVDTVPTADAVDVQFVEQHTPQPPSSAQTEVPRARTPTEPIGETLPENEPAAIEENSSTVPVSETLASANLPSAGSEQTASTHDTDTPPLDSADHSILNRESAAESEMKMPVSPSEWEGADPPVAEIQKKTSDSQTASPTTEGRNADHVFGDVSPRLSSAFGGIVEPGSGPTDVSAAPERVRPIESPASPLPSPVALASGAIPSVPTSSRRPVIASAAPPFSESSGDTPGDESEAVLPYTEQVSPRKVAARLPGTASSVHMPSQDVRGTTVHIGKIHLEVHGPEPQPQPPTEQPPVPSPEPHSRGMQSGGVPSRVVNPGRFYLRGF